MGALGLPLDPVSHPNYHISSSQPKKGILKLPSKHKSVGMQKKKIGFDASVDDALRKKLAAQGLSKRRIERKIRELKSSEPELGEIEYFDQVSDKITNGILYNITSILKIEMNGYRFKDKKLKEIKNLIFDRQDTIDDIERLAKRIKKYKRRVKTLRGMEKEAAENKLIRLEAKIEIAYDDLDYYNSRFRKKYFRDRPSLRQIEAEIAQNEIDKNAFRQQFSEVVSILRYLKEEPHFDLRSMVILNLKEKNQWFNTIFNKLLMSSNIEFRGRTTENERVIELVDFWIQTPFFDADLKRAKKNLRA